MSKQHVVEIGECLASIAYQNGFFLETVWEQGENKGLRDLRHNPYELVPGDVVFIPDKRGKEEECGTNAQHLFVRKGVPEKLRLRMTRDNQPRSNEPYTLIIDGVEFKGVTGADGTIEQSLMPDAKQCRLLIGEGPEEYEIQLRQLQPATEEIGLRARLSNLGYLDAGAADPDSVKQAIRAFQEAHKLAATGSADAGTLEKLKEQHGS